MRRQALLRLARLRGELGVLGLFSLALLAAAALFYGLALKPAQEENEALTQALARHAGRPAAGQLSGAGDRLAALYKFLQKSEAPTDWLAKLYGIATATGVELQSASYQTQGGPKGSGARVERYEITLPVSGSYGQIRDFVKRSLAEIPILSIDQMSIRRQTRQDGTVQAELRLTLHLVKS